MRHRRHIDGRLIRRFRLFFARVDNGRRLHDRRRHRLHRLRFRRLIQHHLLRLYDHIRLIRVDGPPCVLRKVNGLHVAACCHGGFHPVVHRIKHRTLVHKAHLQLRRMHVHVDDRRRQLDVQHARREFTHHNRALVRFLQRHTRRAAAHKTPVDEEILHAAVRSARNRRRDIPVHANAAQGIIHRQQSAGKLLAEHRIDRRAQLAIARRVQHFLALANEAERDFRMRKRNFVHQPRHGVALCGVFLQKLHTRRHVKKQVARRNGRAKWAARVFDLHVAAAFGGIVRAD